MEMLVFNDVTVWAKCRFGQAMLKSGLLAKYEVGSDGHGNVEVWDDFRGERLLPCDLASESDWPVILCT